MYTLYLLCFSFYTGPVGARVEAGARCEAVEIRGLNDPRVDAYLDDAQSRFGASELVLDTVAKVVWLPLDDSRTRVRLSVWPAVPENRGTDDRISRVLDGWWGCSLDRA